jgi:hypothetical protein
MPRGVTINDFAAYCRRCKRHFSTRKLLQVADTVARKELKCPQCGGVIGKKLTSAVGI